MTGHLDAERVLDALLVPEDDQLPDRVLDAVLTEIARTPQRRALRVPWRYPSMSDLSRRATVAIAAVVAVIAVAGALYLAKPNEGLGRPTSSPSASPQSSAVDTGDWVAFTSPIHGYAARHPAGFTFTSAAREGELEEIVRETGYVFDQVAGNPDRVKMVAVSNALGSSTEDAWIAEYRGRRIETVGAACFPEPTAWETVAVDGHDGGLYLGCGFAEWLGFVDGRAYLFRVVEPSGMTAGASTRALLEAFLSTVTIGPHPRATSLSPIAVTSSTFRVPFSMTVPATWTERREGGDYLFAFLPHPNDPEIPIVGVDVVVVDQVYQDNCNPGAADPVRPLGAAVDDLATYLLGIPELHATVVDASASVGGLSGTAIDEAMVTTQRCVGDAAVWPIELGPYLIYESERKRIWIVGDETRRVVISITTIESQWEARFPEAEDVLQSIRFE